MVAESTDAFSGSHCHFAEPVTLTYFVGPYATNYVQMFAAIIIAIAPTVVVYSLFSNQIVEGLTTGAVKG